jgi:hypothetical protein
MKPWDLVKIRETENEARTLVEIFVPPPQKPKDGI